MRPTTARLLGLSHLSRAYPMPDAILWGRHECPHVKSSWTLLKTTCPWHCLTTTLPEACGEACMGLWWAVRRGYWIPYNWRSSWEVSPGPLQVLWTLLATEASLQSQLPSFCSLRSESCFLANTTVTALQLQSIYRVPTIGLNEKKKFPLWALFWRTLQGHHLSTVYGT